MFEAVTLLHLQWTEDVLRLSRMWRISGCRSVSTPHRGSEGEHDVIRVVRGNWDELRGHYQPKGTTRTDVCRVSRQETTLVAYQ